MSKQKLSPIAQAALIYNLERAARDGSPFLTEHMRRALVASAILSVMVARYEAEGEFTHAR